MLNLNETKLLGQVCTSPELRYLPDGSAQLNFVLATNRYFKTRNNPEWQVSSCFVPIYIFDERAEKFQHLKKGERVFIAGELSNKEINSQNKKEPVTILVLKVRSIQHVDKRQNTDQKPTPPPNDKADSYGATVDPGEPIPLSDLSEHWGDQQVWHLMQPLLFWKGDTNECGISNPNQNEGE